MPEGDTIYRTAMTLRSAIGDGVVTEVETRESGSPKESLAQQRLIDIEARGKHLLMRFSDQHVLHSHMGMTGSWHLYHRDEPWKKPARRATIAIWFSDIVAVCFSPKTLEWLSPSAFKRHRYLRQLGPDILAATFDEDEVLRRIRLHNAVPIGQAILNQTILCGVGNVYKSEVLFLQRLNPMLTVEQLGDEQLTSLIARTQKLMKQNLAGYPRRTRFFGDPQRVWVYGRKGHPCFECGTAIDMQRQGDLGRSTYYCPTCQRV